MAEQNELRMRLIRADDVPASHQYPDEEVRFGLQDTKGVIVPGARGPNGEFLFDFVLTVKDGPDARYPSFGGRFASGKPEDRFVYLSWWSVARGVWINRVKARLGGIDWKIVRAAQRADRPLVADMTGWVPGDKRKQVEWRVG